MALTLILGGVRSGKSRLGLETARSWGLPVVVIATAEPLDEEMAARIARHRSERPKDWRTIEEPIDLTWALGEVPDGSGILLDCLTLWVSNLMGKGASDEEIRRSSAEAGLVAAEHGGPVVAITNEVGWGVVPDNAPARRFSELLGTVNAEWSRAAMESLLVVAGRTLRL
jgi:adenosylcobinamide kinase/adenosylcobinamide-phosphate guanylyltransferase